MDGDLVLDFTLDGDGDLPLQVAGVDLLLVDGEMNDDGGVANCDLWFDLSVASQVAPVGRVGVDCR